MEKKIYKINNDLSIWVYDNKNPQTNKNRPAIVWIHGGGWNSADPSSFGDGYDFYLEKGAVCFGIDYRLVPDQEIDTDCVYIKRCVSDCVESIGYIRKNADMFGIDPHKITVIGESAGGHLALCTVTDVVKQIDENAMPDACIAYNPVTEMVGKWADCASKVSDGLTSEQFLKRHGIIRKISPANNIIKTDIPLLLLTGIDDKVVYAGDVIEFCEDYKKVGNDAEIVLYKNTVHAFALPYYYQYGLESRDDSLIKSFYFLKKYNML